MALGLSEDDLISQPHQLNHVAVYFQLRRYIHISVGRYFDLLGVDTSEIDLLLGRLLLSQLDHDLLLLCNDPI